jgi:hypothetical protein
MLQTGPSPDRSASDRKAALPLHSPGGDDGLGNWTWLAISATDDPSFAPVIADFWPG